MEKNKNQNEEIKTDLKHDSMEFATPIEGEEALDIDDVDFEDDEISAEELDALEDDDADEAAAFASVEEELLTDDEALPDEDWTDDLPDDITSLDEADAEEESL